MLQTLNLALTDGFFASFKHFYLDSNQSHYFTEPEAFKVYTTDAIGWVRTSYKRLERWLGSSLLHRAVIVSFFIVVIMRLWFAILGTVIIQASDSGGEPNEWVAHSRYTKDPEGVGRLFSPWQRWDAQYYLRIADDGYLPNDPTNAYFPLFPILIRVVSAISGQDSLVGSFVVCTIATFGAFVLLYLIASDLTNETVAKYAVIYWAVFPTAFYLFGGYAESLQAASSLASLWFARQRRWWLAGIFAMASSLARPLGILIVFPLVIEGWQAGKSLRDRLRVLIPLAGVAVAMGAWMLYQQIRFQDALLWVHAEDNFWGRVYAWPGQTVWWTIQLILTRQGPFNNVIDLTLTFIVSAAMLVAVRQLPLSFTVYAALMLVIPLMNYSGGALSLMPLISAGRRAVVIFPAFIALASVWRGRWRTPLWICSSAGLQLILFVLFVQWVWVD